MRAVNNQKGAALVVCLIVLLVMSVIGVTSVSNSTVQQRMASNLRQQQLAENAAEHALRAAERYIAATIVSTPALDSFASNLGASFFMSKEMKRRAYTVAPPTGDVTDVSSWSGRGIEAAGLGTDATSQNPRYLIEYVGRTEVGRRREISKDDDNIKNFRYNFRITAIGWGVDPNAYAVLQSTFETIRISDI